MCAVVITSRIPNLLVKGWVKPKIFIICVLYQTILDVLRRSMIECGDDFNLRKIHVD
jgi:hypothetical protein